MAQDLEKVFPEMVKQSDHQIMGDDGNLTDKTINIKAVNYGALIPVLVKGMQEQQAQIEAQQKQIDALLKKLESIEEKNKSEQK